MYFWRLEPLKQELRRGQLAPTEAVKYAIATGVTLSALTYVPIENQAFTLSDGILLALTTAITAGGIFLAYQANGGAAGADFAARYLALGWVVGVRVMAVSLVGLFVMFVVMTSATLVFTALYGGELPDAGFMAAAIGFTLAAYLFFYWRLVVHMRDVAQTPVLRPEDGSSAL